MDNNNINPNSNNNIIPITRVYLLDVPLESDYKNTLYFANATDQQNYFQSKIIGSYSYNDFTYQRKDNIIRIPEQYDKIYNCNYVMYQNKNYSNKWFYAFVTKLDYISDGRTDLHIQTDVMQTWAFDYTLKPSFVEREHTNDDTIGNNTLPENLETGPYVTCRTPSKINDMTGDVYICIGVSDLVQDITLNAQEKQRKYNGIYSGLYYFMFETPNDASDFIYLYDLRAKADAISSVFLVPEEFLTGEGSMTAQLVTYTTSDAQTHSFTAWILPSSNDEVNLLPNNQQYVEIPRNNKLAGNYQPVNNKLYTFPFNYMILTNNSGTDIPLNYEDFYSTPKFSVVGSITPGCSIKCVPVNYKTSFETANIDHTYNYGINGGKLPVCSWNSDTYTNWLTQNGVNNALSMVSAGLKIGLGAVTLNGGAVAGGVGQIAGTLATVYEHSLVPDQARGNTNSGDVTYSTGNSCFTVYQQSIKPEYARIIDNYFSMFGYQTNRVKLPNSNHRSEWWYTKTIDVNLNGNIPQNDIEQIKSNYNNGITFWKNPEHIENYNLTNSII